MSSTLSCNKILVINFFFFSLFQANLPGLFTLRCGFREILGKNKGLEEMRGIARSLDVREEESEVDLDISLNPSNIANMKYAPLVFCNGERTFSC